MSHPPSPTAFAALVLYYPRILTGGTSRDIDALLRFIPSTTTLELDGAAKTRDLLANREIHVLSPAV
jgi:hypothetical protein